MPEIQILDRHVVYENPIPHVRSRQAYFPGLVQLPSGDLLALFLVAEAIDGTDGTTMVARSRDEGRTWELEGPLHEKAQSHRYDSDSMKAVLLANGNVVATGYRFHRDGRDQLIANPETNGVRPGDNLVSRSTDDGHTWSQPKIIPRSRPELIEASGPPIQLADGTVLAAGALFPMWDGSHPSGFLGALLKSNDDGVSWDDSGVFFRDPTGRYMPAEPRLCEMQPGRIVALVWMADHHTGENLPNHVTVSHDGGATWSDPIDTGEWGQASNLMHWQDDLLLTIHSQRERDIGLYVRLVDFSGDRWKTQTELNIWDRTTAQKVGEFGTMAQNLKFGQPSLLRLKGGDVLATHWAVEDGQAKILTHRLRVEM